MIVDRETSLLDGASRIWDLWGYSRQPDERSATWRDLRPFIELAIEYERLGPEAWDSEAAVVDAAAALLAGGGLRIGPPVLR